MSTILELKIASVTCKDETGGSFAERFGNDEIYLGGFAVDSNARTKKVSPFLIDSSFDDGDVKRFNPARPFASFSIGNITQPVKFHAGMLLIEKDSGGMDSATQKVYEAVTKEISKKKEEMANRLEPGITTVVAGIPVGLIWAAVKPTIYNYVRDKIAGWFGDEIFPLQDISTTIMNANHTWNGRKTSPLSMIEFKGHNGHYQLMCYWELR